MENSHTPVIRFNIRRNYKKYCHNNCRELGHDVVERPISRTELYLADEIFLTGTAAEIIAITKIDGNVIGNGREDHDKK